MRARIDGKTARSDSDSVRLGSRRLNVGAEEQKRTVVVDESIYDGLVADDAATVARARHLIDAATDRDSLTMLIDTVAVAASTGSDPALGLLLNVVQSHSLAMPAIRRLIANPHDAEDVNQDVLMKLTTAISGFDGRAKFSTWLFRVASNTAVDFIRRRRDIESLGDDEPVALSARLSSMIATRTVVQAALEVLPTTFREPVHLRDIEGCSYEDIAERLDINLNTVKSRIARGRAMLAGHVGGLDG